MPCTNSDFHIIVHLDYISDVDFFSPKSNWNTFTLISLIVDGILQMSTSSMDCYTVIIVGLFVYRL